MLQTVHVGCQSIETYSASAGADAIAELRRLAAPLSGARILHLNATPYGGGVAEILRSEIPLLCDLGLDVTWGLITGDDAFFSVTKAIHNGLQGAPRDLTPAERETYLSISTRNAHLLQKEYDLIVVHDPQPLAVLQLHGRGNARWIWRCHIDTSEPHPSTWAFLRQFLEGYDATVFTMADFVPPDQPVARVEIIPPAIDPESPKNLDLELGPARRILRWIGLDVDRPLVTQVSRFDPWKDPLGVIAAYRLVKQRVPALQLALVGSMALDDPEGWHVYQDIQQTSKDDSDVHVFTNLTGVGNIEVNAFQRLSQVVIQKSIREGFGLVVSESLWKGTPVVAGRAGGIPLQLPDGSGGFLVDDVEGCADRTLWLLEHPDDARELGARGREVVRERFLLTRLIADELGLYASLLSGRAASPQARPTPAPQAALAAPSAPSRIEPAPRPAPRTAAYVRAGSELRQDPFTRAWVVVAPKRSQRPHDVPKPQQVVGDGTCPFESGHEDKTPTEVWRLDAPGGGWRVRVVPNQFPMMSPDGSPRRLVSPAGFVSMASAGHHEVIIESPDHSADLARLDDAGVRGVLEAYRSRYIALRNATSNGIIVVFRNHGAAAGTSLVHPHSQIVSAPVVPVGVRHRLDVAMDHFDDMGSSLYVDVLDRELRDGRRIIHETARFVAFQPWAAGAPYETWIMPRMPQACFGDASDPTLDELAPVLRNVLRALAEELDDPDYNAVLQSAPIGEENREYFTWHVRIVPRLAIAAGFELGSGMPVNPTRPEETAAALRGQVVRYASAQV